MSEYFLSEVAVNILINYSKNMIEKFYKYEDDIRGHKELINKRIEKGILNNILLEKVVSDTEMRKKKIIEELFILKKDLEKLGKTIVISDSGIYLKDFKQSE